jgi:hypothetical protein
MRFSRGIKIYQFPVFGNNNLYLASYSGICDPRSPGCIGLTWWSGVATWVEGIGWESDQLAEGKQELAQ